MKVLVQGGEIQTALPVVQSLGRHGVDVVVGSKYNKTISSYSKYCKRHFQYPSPEKFPDEFIQCLLAEVIVLSKNRDCLLPYVKIPLSDHDTLFKAHNKAETLQIALNNSIPCPKTFFVDNVDDVKKIQDDLIFPVIMKPTISAGSKGLEYVTEQEKLLETFEKTSKLHGKMVIQELIPPGGVTYGFEGLFNKNSEPRAVFVHKRLREFPITGGPSTLRVGVDNEEVKELGIRLLQALQWYGLAMVEFKVDPRDNRPKLMEINGRFWGSLPVSIASGVDFPYLLCKLATEGDIKPDLDYKKGMKARLLFYEDFKHLFAILKGQSTRWGYRSPGRLKTLREFMKIYEKDVTYDYLSFDDPVPGILRILSPVFKPYE